MPADTRPDATVESTFRNPSSSRSPMPRTRDMSTSGRSRIGTAHTWAMAFCAASVMPSPAQTAVTEPTTRPRPLPLSVRSRSSPPMTGTCPDTESRTERSSAGWCGSRNPRIVVNMSSSGNSEKNARYAMRTARFVPPSSPYFFTTAIVNAKGPHRCCRRSNALRGTSGCTEAAYPGRGPPRRYGRVDLPWRRPPDGVRGSERRVEPVLPQHRGELAGQRPVVRRVGDLGSDEVDVPVAVSRPDAPGLAREPVQLPLDAHEQTRLVARPQVVGLALDPTQDPPVGVLRAPEEPRLGARHLHRARV